MGYDICITGVSSGIGRELARLLIRDGHRVWGIARRTILLQEVKQELGEHFFYTAGDVGDAQTFTRTKEAMRTAHFYPTVFILAAAEFHEDYIHGFDFGCFTAMLQTNLLGVATTISAFLPEAQKQKKGHFILLSSIAAFRPNKRGLGYPASKAAASMLFRGLALASDAPGLLFTTLYLGPISTSMWEGRSGPLIATPEAAARTIASLIRSQKTVVYWPMLSTTLFRITALLPDRVYAILTGLIKK